MTVINNNGAGVFNGVYNGGLTEFNASSTADRATINNNPGKGNSGFGGQTAFKDSSTAASATINNRGGARSFAFGGFTQFQNSSTAGSATINNLASTGFDAGGGATAFFDNSTAGNATINNEGLRAFTGDGGSTLFRGASSAGNATITNNGGSVNSGGASGSGTQFQDNSTAGSATIINNGGTGSGGTGGVTHFFPSVGIGSTSAGNATIINNGGTVNGAGGGSTFFEFDSTAGSATLIANGGTGGGGGGRIVFLQNSIAGAARIEVFGNGNLDISAHKAPGMTIRSIEGTGNVFLGANKLTLGNNELSTVFSGVMRDGGFGHGTGGSLTKLGTGTLTLSGANTYTGDTKVNAGVLRVDGSIASPNTFVNRGGTLGGTGTVGGDVSNEGIVAPGDSPGTLHVAGNYSQGSGGALDIEIASLLSFDRLTVSGTATLSGTLDVSLEGYTGHEGDIFTILTSSGLSGNFLNLDLPTLSDGLFFSEHVTSNNVFLTVNGPAGVPDHGSTLVLLAGAVAALFAIRRTVSRERWRQGAVCSASMCRPNEYSMEFLYLIRVRRELPRV